MVVKTILKGGWTFTKEHDDSINASKVTIVAPLTRTVYTETDETPQELKDEYRKYMIRNVARQILKLEVVRELVAEREERAREEGYRNAVNDLGGNAR